MKLGVFSVFALCLTGACGGGGGDSGSDGGGSGGTFNGEAFDAPAGIWVRYAHMAPGTGAFDVCYETDPNVWVGPVLATQAGRAAGVAYGQVSQYIQMPTFTAPNRGKLRVIAAGTSCMTPMPGWNGNDSAAAFGVGPGVHSTLAVHSLPAGPTFDARTTDMHQANTNPGSMHFTPYIAGVTNADVGAIVGGAFVSWKESVGEGAAASGFTKMAAGSGANFVPFLAPASGVTIAVRATGTTPILAMVSGVNLVGADAWSLWAFGKMGDAANPPKLIACQDYVRASGLTRCF